MIRAVIAGLGSIGRRHLANLRAIEPDADITVLRRSTVEGVPPGADRVVTDAAAALGARPDCVLVTGPSVTHLEIAMAAARSGAHLFIEKPIAHDAAGVPALIAACAENKASLCIGYNFRFHKPLQLLRDAVAAGRIGALVSARAEVGQYLPDWRPGSDYRQSVSARADMGGGALLELSHEFDYLRWIVGDVVGVSARTAQLGGLEIDVEDVAEVLLDFESGAIGSVHLDMVQRTPARGCKLVGSEGTITWDGMTDAVRLYSASTHQWSDLRASGQADRNEMYIAELQNFLGCVRGTATPGVTGTDGLRALQVALAARRSSAERCAVAL